jgi:hypothetical protein
MKTLLKTLLLLLFLGNVVWANLCLETYSYAAKEQRIHQLITETLYIGVPIKAEPFSANKNKNSLWLVTLKNPKNNHTIKAIFKPRYLGDGDGWNRPPMEYVSYELGRMLDLDLIPPVAYRYSLTLNSDFFYEGSMQFFVEDTTLLKNISNSQWNTPPKEFISNARILDILLQNPDRHSGNFIYGSHWVSGIEKPILIDQAANMRQGTNIRLSTVGPFNEEKIAYFDPKTIVKLKLLNKKMLKKLKPFISDSEIEKILNHRYGILRNYKNSLKRSF